MDNPYGFDGPVRDPQMFFGRDHILAELAAFVRNNQSVSIIGPSKIGKTSLLLRLFHDDIPPVLGLNQDHVLTYLNCDILRYCERDMIFSQLASAIIAQAAGMNRSQPESVNHHSFPSQARIALEKAVRSLNRKGSRVVLILDDFEFLSANPNLDTTFFNTLRSIAGRYQLAYITASARPLIELTYANHAGDCLSSPFFNIFAPLYLGLLSEAEARRLIREPAEAAGIRISPHIEAGIYELAGAHPLALQIACFHLLKNPDDLAVVEKCTTQSLLPHLLHIWNDCTLDQQHVLANLEQYASVHFPPDSRLLIILRDLEQKGLVVAGENSLRYVSQIWTNFVHTQEPT